MDILKPIDTTCAVCFSGHRPDRLPGKGNLDMPETQKLTIILLKQIEDAIKRGKHTFIHGLMAGWDILAAEQIIALKEQYPNIQLVSIAPYKEQFFAREKCWTDDWVKRAKNVCRLHDVGVKIAERYRTGIYYERNRVLVDHSSELICYCDGGKGGSAYTVEYALKNGLEVINIASK